MREILTHWTTPSGGGKTTVMFFDEISSVASQRSALHAMYTAFADRLDNAVAWTIEVSGRLLFAGTGALVGEWTDPVVRAGAGSLVGQATADATQVLLRWGTGEIVGGRFLRGRTFIPGLEVNEIQDGNLAPDALVDFSNAAQGLVDAGVGFGVWHRPTGGAGGVLHPAVTGSAWNELAVLRRRRG